MPTPADPTAADPTAPAVGWRAKLPNALTIARLALTGWFIAILAVPTPGFPPQGDPETPRTWALWALALFVIAALTDAADGYLARKWNAVSKFGRIADPLADKALILGAFVMLAGRDLGLISGVAPWMAVTILFRELLVTTARSVFESSGIDFSAAWSGKIKMIIQSIAVPLILIDMYRTPEAGAMALWSAWGATIATAVSLVPYLVRIGGLIRTPPTD